MLLEDESSGVHTHRDTRVSVPTRLVVVYFTFGNVGGIGLQLPSRWCQALSRTGGAGVTSHVTWQAGCRSNSRSTEGVAVQAATEQRAVHSATTSRQLLCACMCTKHAAMC